MRKIRVLALAVLIAAVAIALLCHAGYPQRLWARLFPSETTYVPITSVVLYDPGTVAWQNCLEQLHVHADIVFLGDSLTRGGRFDSYFPDQSICNLGLDGDTLVGMVYRIGMIESVEPSKIFLMAGINSLYYETPELAIQDYESLLNLIFESSSAEIYIHSVLPVAKEKLEEVPGWAFVALFNEQLKALAEKYGCAYIDLYPQFSDEEGFMLPELTIDGVHLSEEGYQIWIEAIRDYI